MATIQRFRPKSWPEGHMKRLQLALSLHLTPHHISQICPKAPVLTGLLLEESACPGADDTPGAAADPEGIWCTQRLGRAPEQQQWLQGALAREELALCKAAGGHWGLSSPAPRKVKTLHSEAHPRASGCLLVSCVGCSIPKETARSGCWAGPLAQDGLRVTAGDSGECTSK